MGPLSVDAARVRCFAPLQWRVGRPSGSFTFLAGRMGGEGKAFGGNGKREGR